MGTDANRRAKARRKSRIVGGWIPFFEKPYKICESGSLLSSRRSIELDYDLLEMLVKPPPKEAFKLSFKESTNQVPHLLVESEKAHFPSQSLCHGALRRAEPRLVRQFSNSYRLP